MLALAFTFPAGHYHATPWDRHVNEGAVAWPPEPWRVLRALIATWHRKVKYLGPHQESTFVALIESLTQELPRYTLPVATHSHTRHYMPQGKVGGNPALIFDAFTTVRPGEAIYMTWPTLRLPDDQAGLLDDLLAVIGYLGRAESWVDAARVSNQPEPNCEPGDQAVDPDTGEVRGEVVTLFAPVASREYWVIRERLLSDKRVTKKLVSTLPESLLGALSVETADLRKQGWSQPPAARKVSYLRRVDAFRPKRAISRETALPFTTVRYLLIGRPLPRVEDSLRIGELLRSAVMSEAKQQLGEDAIPSVFSGHGLPERNRHEHAFYIPCDENDDGRIDRLLLHVPAGMGSTERRIVERLRSVWMRDGGEWRLALEAIGGFDVGGCVTTSSAEWQSVTPYLHPWHIKKDFGVEDQIRRECRERALPEPVHLERLDHIRVGKQIRRSVHFHRFRGKRGLNQPDRHGSFWRLRFAEPLRGPLALGFACHFGLGLFAPVANVQS